MRALLVALFLAAVSCSSDTGATCSTDSDCAAGTTCHAGRVAGYCAAACETEGSADGCPSDTLCKAIQGGPKRCLLVCEEQAECPNGSNCTGLTGSSSKVCEPQP